MKKTLIAILATTALGVLTSCGGVSEQNSAEPTGVAEETGTDQLVDYTTMYRDAPLHCVGVNLGNTNGQLDCDYTRFYAENPDLLSEAPTD